MADSIFKFERKLSVATLQVEVGDAKKEFKVSYDALTLGNAERMYNSIVALLKDSKEIQTGITEEQMMEKVSSVGNVFDSVKKYCLEMLGADQLNSIVELIATQENIVALKMIADACFDACREHTKNMLKQEIGNA